MKKDIFVDANIANKFADTGDENYIDLIKWLLNNGAEHPDENAHLVISNTLRSEYFRGNQNCDKTISICTIYFQLQKEDRLNVKSNRELDDFKKNHMDKRRWKKLKSKASDKEHIPLVFLSDRKMVISEDVNFLDDLINFPKLGKLVKCAVSPENLAYK